MAQSLAYLYSERTRILQDIANVQQQIAYAQQNANASILAGLQARLASDQELLAVIDAQIQIGEREQTLGTASAGNLAKDDQLATAPGSLPQAPNSPAQILTPDGRVTPAPDTSTATTATPPVTENNVDTGTDAPVRTLQQTQATPAAPDGLLRDRKSVV